MPDAAPGGPARERGAIGWAVATAPAWQHDRRRREEPSTGSARHSEPDQREGLATGCRPSLRCKDSNLGYLIQSQASYR